MCIYMYIHVYVAMRPVVGMVAETHIDKVCDVCKVVCTVIKSNLPRGAVSQLPHIVRLVTQVIERCA